MATNSCLEMQAKATKSANLSPPARQDVGAQIETTDKPKQPMGWERRSLPNYTPVINERWLVCSG